MKKTVLFIFMVLVSISLSAQKSKVSFFSEDGQRFWVIVDGEKINEEPHYNVKNYETTADFIKVKIIFQNSEIPSIDRTIPCRDVEENKPMDATWVVKEIKGKWKLRISSGQAMTTTTTTTTTNNQAVQTQQPTNTWTQTNTIVTTTTDENNQQNPNSENISMSMNIDGQEMGINVKIPQEEDINSSTTSSSTTTTTTITTTSSSDLQPENPPPPPPPPAPTHYVMPGYSGPIGCPWPINNDQFNGIYNSISSKNFDDTKLTIAKQIINSNCLLCSQVKQIMTLLDFEDNKLELAKWAYGHTYDIGNYYMLNDAFDFESTIEELSSYINGYTW